MTLRPTQCYSRGERRLPEHRSQGKESPEIAECLLRKFSPVSKKLNHARYLQAKWKSWATVSWEGQVCHSLTWDLRHPYSGGVWLEGSQRPEVTLVSPHPLPPVQDDHRPDAGPLQELYEASETSRSCSSRSRSGFWRSGRGCRPTCSSVWKKCSCSKTSPCNQDEPGLLQEELLQHDHQQRELPQELQPQ